MDEWDDLEEPIQPIEQKRYCDICGSVLSGYNKGTRCFRHGPDALEEESQNPYKIGPLEQKEEGVVDVQTILRIVSEAYKISIPDLLSHRRTGPIAWARQVVMFLIRQDLGYSFPRIARELRRRNHTTVIYACRKIQDLMTTNLEAQAAINEIRTHYVRTGEP